jgi:uncharacterized protein
VTNLDYARTSPRVASYASPVHEDTSLRPLSGRERLPLVDALRGLAILGVLAAYALWNLGSPPYETWTRLDRVIDLIGALFVDTKFLTIFAFLFGAGTAQQWRRAESRGVSVTAFHLRRMLFLLAVGLLHATLLRNGDILAPYAIMGIALLLARHRTARQLAVAAIVLALLPYGIRLVLKTAGVTLASRPEAGRSEHYWSANLAWVRYWYLTNPLTEWPRILAIMVAGVFAERVGFIKRLATDRRLALKTLVIAALIAITTRALLYVIVGLWSAQRAPVARGMVLSQTFHLSAWSLAAVYAAALALLCQRLGWPARLAWLRAVGRMAFTNYLLQALLIVPLCLVFGWFDAVTPTRGLALAAGVAAIQIWFSVRWLRRHDYGPVESLWRTVTYGRR